MILLLLLQRCVHMHNRSNSSANTSTSISTSVDVVVNWSTQHILPPRSFASSSLSCSSLSCSSLSYSTGLDGGHAEMDAVAQQCADVRV